MLGCWKILRFRMSYLVGIVLLSKYVCSFLGLNLKCRSGMEIACGVEKKWPWYDGHLVFDTGNLWVV